MTDTDGLYTLKIKGEQHTYEFRGSEQHGYGVLCDTLSDLTGYKSAYLAGEVLRAMNISEERKVDPAAQGGWNATPTFIIKRVA